MFVHKKGKVEMSDPCSYLAPFQNLPVGDSEMTQIVSSKAELKVINGQSYLSNNFVSPLPHPKFNTVVSFIQIVLA